MHKNTIEKRNLVRALVAQHYEEGRHDRCKRWVYLNIVKRTYPMSERTFFRYLSKNSEAPQYVHPTLF
jgi:hypothetical protein